MRISDWSSDVCSSDLHRLARDCEGRNSISRIRRGSRLRADRWPQGERTYRRGAGNHRLLARLPSRRRAVRRDLRARLPPFEDPAPNSRSEEHTSELQSLMRISYAVFCLKKKNTIL